MDPFHHLEDHYCTIDPDLVPEYETDCPGLCDICDNKAGTYCFECSENACKNDDGECVCQHNTTCGSMVDYTLFDDS
jgi:hypothetical protein